MTSSVGTNTLKKKTSSVISGDLIHPIFTSNYKQTLLPELKELAPQTDEVDITSLPQLDPEEIILMPYRDDTIKINSHTIKKEVTLSIRSKIKVDN